ncbi:MAG: DegV family protein [Firmicutes bacterium]|nr:DegV family protein [Bacillota bacterium]
MRRKTVLFATSTCDLDLDIFKKYQINFIPNLVVMNGEEVIDDRSSDLTEYYKSLKKGLMPTTCQNNVDMFMGYFSDMAKDNDIVHVEISSGLTSTTEAAKQAMKLLKEKYPEGDFYAVDSLNASAGQALLLLRAVELRDSGQSAKEISDHLEEYKSKIGTYVTLKNLSHMYRGGRVSGSQKFLGNMLNICPIIEMDREGHLTPIGKAHGFKTAIKTLVDNIDKFIKDGEEYEDYILLVHSNEENNVDYLKSLIEAKYKNAKILVNEIGMNIGVHTGPGAVAVAYWRKDDR